MIDPAMIDPAALGSETRMVYDVLHERFGDAQARQIVAALVEDLGGIRIWLTAPAHVIRGQAERRVTAMIAAGAPLHKVVREPPLSPARVRRLMADPSSSAAGPVEGTGLS